MNMNLNQEMGPDIGVRLFFAFAVREGKKHKKMDIGTIFVKHITMNTLRTDLT
ncbi:hypothetical protein PaelaDRAFT_5883 [Paenibacillus lactis 154]|uniref:Uncharacterized protein n=1 Tax=Paenibacillus lactis 154 TaxID=743719 RepID=G4HPH2_9BACL|nr:hypothetical protein PaelaDRAFT_5883 [Paenibacillus lactis 154]